MRSLRLFAAALVFTAGAVAQTWDYYTVSYTVTLAGAQTALAVQLPSTGSYRAEILSAAVQCTSSCPVRFEVNGAAATEINATAATVTAVNPESVPVALVATPTVQAWTGTGIPAGTQVSPSWTIPANALVPFGGSRTLVSKAGTNVNYIMRIPNNYTGTVTMSFAFRSTR